MEAGKMKFWGNVLWFFLCGLWLGLMWLIAGLLWCITIIGAPIGLQCFKFAQISFLPFGKEIVSRDGAGSLILNVLWLIFGGLELAAASAIIGLILCVTVIGVPFGMQCFKIARLALMPFGSEVVQTQF
jgi:hypothetical protein